MTLALWIGGVFLVGAILTFWLINVLRHVDQEPWW